ncbi:MAG TPA: PilZ domain-containing protein [Candidatus Acidoferrum sp.]|nr:PilZ domain-containing protein [Candidatus Acidoferrum sp.]
MPLRATLPNGDNQRESRPKPAANTTPKLSGHGTVASIAAPAASGLDHKAVEVLRALRDFHLLLRSERLYDKNHPSRLDSLDTAYDSLRQITESLEGLEIRVERGGIVAPKIGQGHLPDTRGEMQALAADLHRVGIWSLVFSKKFHVGELDTLARLMKQSLLELDEPAGDAGSAWWPARLLENRVEGISVNTQTDRKVDTVLASLIGALVAYGGNAPREAGDSPIKAPDLDDLMATLRLLARLTPPLEGARGLSPEEAARAIHGAMEEASRESVRMLLHSVSQYAPRDGEQPLPYLLRLSENTILEFLTSEFAGGSLTPPAVRPSFHRLGDVLVESGAYTGPHASQHLSSLAVAWAADTHREHLMNRFWLELPAREKSAVVRGQDVWCVPVAALKQTLGQLVDTGADAPRREARSIALNYLRRLELPEGSAKRLVAAGLNELVPLLESLWPNQLPEELSRSSMKALQAEAAPETAALLAAFVEALGRIAVSRGDYTGFEFILTGLERAPRDKEHDHMTALATRLVAQDRWFLLVDASLANRPLDPVLPRLLQRDPERLLDRLTLLLTEPRGADMLPAMSRLLRTIGVPVLNLLETRLYEARRQRVTAAIKLLAAADSERLLRGLARAIGSWEWNLQDLAVSELSRPSNSASAQSAAFVFSAILADAHPLVVPMMIDQIGLAQEATGVPQLLEIAAGEHEVLRDQFVRIKAIEALGRMRSYEAAELLHTLIEKRDGLAYAEPAGLRAAAEDALALIENRPSFQQAAAAFGAPAQSSSSYLIPRRYVRVPLESPLRAQIEGAPAGLARVKTISLGGAYLESPKKLTVGDSIKLEVRAGLRKINFTAVVRNIGQDGNGIEFVHMRDEDRERLRKFVQRHLQL